MQFEQPLTGGNMSIVSRVGDTVRRQANPWTPQVHTLLNHLRAQGIQEVPIPLGFDEQGREIVSFIPGQVGHDPLPESLRSEAILIAAAQWLRCMHDATEAFAHQWQSGWQTPSHDPVEVICHGDFAPYNCVFDNGKLVGVIDFDNAHPAPRSWDISYALYRFVPLTALTNPDGYGTLTQQAKRTLLFCDAYGLKDRSGIIQAVRTRLAHMADFLRVGATNGDPRMQANIEAGHLAIYENDLAYVEANDEALTRALIGV